MLPLARIAAATAFMVVCCLLVRGAASGFSPLVELGLVVGAGVGSYLGCSKLLGNEDMGRLAGALRWRADAAAETAVKEVPGA